MRKFWIFGLLALLLVSPVWAKAPQVVVSIKPIHSLVSAVMEGVAEPELLMSATQSPHTFVLKPSTVELLEAADVVIWVGPAIEGFLAKPLDVLPSNRKIVSLLQTPGLEFMQMRGLHHHDDNHGDHHHNEASWQSDQHIWLDPFNARKITLFIAEYLGALDPQNAARYYENAEIFNARLTSMEKAIAAELKPYRDTDYIVFHDAYQYFEKRFGLKGGHIVSLGHEAKPSAKHIKKLQEVIAKDQPKCLFKEPQLNSQTVDLLAKDTNLPIINLDPLNVPIPTNQPFYMDLMIEMKDSFIACLGS